MTNTKVAIFGAGQIGKAAYKILTDLKMLSGIPVDAFVIDVSEDNIRSLVYGQHIVEDLLSASIEDISEILRSQGVTHVMNAMPFNLNEKVALAAFGANCSYIDFTEDDKMADRVQGIYKDSKLNCAVKCGLAPGFINYIGYDLVGKIDTPESLMISVGALPRNVSYDIDLPENSYNLSWSVDGLVNEYIRPCRIRSSGELIEIPALKNIIKVVLDGTEYEAAHTSGGVGNLARDLVDVPNVAYMTLRYPGHYKYVKDIVNNCDRDFDRIKEEFLDKFPFTDDDVIVVYANAIGRTKDGIKIRRSYSNKFYGVNGLTGIQSTTAGSGVAMLELMLSGVVSGIINHTDIRLGDFVDTTAFKKYYCIR